MSKKPVFNLGTDACVEGGYVVGPIGIHKGNGPREHVHAPFSVALSAIPVEVPARRRAAARFGERSGLPGPIVVDYYSLMWWHAFAGADRASPVERVLDHGATEKLLGALEATATAPDFAPLVANVRFLCTYAPNVGERRWQFGSGDHEASSSIPFLFGTRITSETNGATDIYAYPIERFPRSPHALARRKPLPVASLASEAVRDRLAAGAVASGMRFSPHPSEVVANEIATLRRSLEAPGATH